MTIANTKPIIIFEHTFVYDTELMKGNGTMSENELEQIIIQKIHACADPEAALQIAIATLEKLLMLEQGA